MIGLVNEFGRVMVMVMIDLMENSICLLRCVRGDMPALEEKLNGGDNVWAMFANST